MDVEWAGESGATPQVQHLSDDQDLATIKFTGTIDKVTYLKK